MAPARLRKEKTYPELCGEGGRARLVVLAAEVGGRWSAETAQFITAPANARAESEPSTLKGRMAAAWTRQWSATRACSTARAFALSLLDRRSVSGTGDVVPSAQEVLRDDRFSEFSEAHVFCAWTFTRLIFSISPCQKKTAP